MEMVKIQMQLAQGQSSVVETGAQEACLPVFCGCLAPTSCALRRYSIVGLADGRADPLFPSVRHRSVCQDLSFPLLCSETTRSKRSVSTYRYILLLVASVSLVCPLLSVGCLGFFFMPGPMRHLCAFHLTGHAKDLVAPLVPHGLSLLCL